MNQRLFALLEKEWLETLKNKYLLSLLILLPLIFVGMTNVLLFVMAQIPDAELAGEMSEIPPAWLAGPYAGLSTRELMQAVIAGQMTTMFMLVPMVIPLTIATYSVTGEKRERSLEPLLATPLTTFELLLGKSIAAAAPGVLMTWASGLLFALIASQLVVSERVFALLVSPTWILTMLLLAPAFTVLATTAGLIVSSRVNDPRAAEQIGVIIVMPVIGLFIGQITGLFFLTVPILFLILFLTLAIDAGLLAIAVGLFQRESILTRWK